MTQQTSTYPRAAIALGGLYLVRRRRRARRRRARTYVPAAPAPAVQLVPSGAARWLAGLAIGAALDQWQQQGSRGRYRGPGGGVRS